MRTENFRAAVDEIRIHGGTSQTMYINEVWKRREMTIFGYLDGSAEVFEDTHPYMGFSSVPEAVFALNNIQREYDKALDDNRKLFSDKQTVVKVKSYSVAEWYAIAPRGTYFGD